MTAGGGGCSRLRNNFGRATGRVNEARVRWLRFTGTVESVKIRNTGGNFGSREVERRVFGSGEAEGRRAGGGNLERNFGGV